jgi:hypothetical protein
LALGLFSRFRPVGAFRGRTTAAVQPVYVGDPHLILARIFLTKASTSGCVCQNPGRINFYDILAEPMRAPRVW